MLGLFYNVSNKKKKNIYYLIDERSLCYLCYAHQFFPIGISWLI